MTVVAHKYLLNFSVSPAGGGLKRLTGFARWFDKNGGAGFIIHPRSQNVAVTFPNNSYFPVAQTKCDRIFHDCKYLKNILEKTGMPDLYYSYGIPVYSKWGKINWFHLSNVLPLYSNAIPVPFFRRMEYKYLGYLIKKNYRNADIISAESMFSLGLIKVKDTKKLVLSVNGSDDELGNFEKDNITENIATVVGTATHKALKDSYCIFQKLKQTDSKLKLVLIGDEKPIPHELRNNHDIIIKGQLAQTEVCEWLKRSRYYISTTMIENSYNAASEGIFLAEESYISDIGPHRELLKNIRFNVVQIENVSRPIIYVKRDELSKENLKNWDAVVKDMIQITGTRYLNFK